MLALLMLGVLIGRMWRLGQQPRPVPHLSAVFFNVGDGDSTLIRTPDGRNILIDTGSALTAPALLHELNARKITALDLMVLAGSADENIGAVPALLNSGIVVRSVWEHSVLDQNDAWLAAKAAVRKRNLPVRVVHQNDTFEIGSSAMRLSVIWPPDAGPRARQDALICRVDYGNTAFLLAGPSTGDTEQALLSEAGEKLSCADQYGVLQVAAHGADFGTSLEMLRIATPENAVISCGPRRPPTPGTLHRLQAAGASVWRTDTLGTVTVTTDGQTPPAISGSQQ